jgi:hypothetical protein
MILKAVHIKDQDRCCSQLPCQRRKRCFESPGGGNAPSKTENVTVEAEARGADCQLLSAEVKPSGELAKLLIPLFNANGKAKDALEQGLKEGWKK